MVRERESLSIIQAQHLCVYISTAFSDRPYSSYSRRFLCHECKGLGTFSSITLCSGKSGPLVLADLEPHEVTAGTSIFSASSCGTVPWDVSLSVHPLLENVTHIKRTDHSHLNDNMNLVSERLIQPAAQHRLKMCASPMAPQGLIELLGLLVWPHHCYVGVHA